MLLVEYDELKILVIIPSLKRGGAERVVSLLTREWCKSHEVIVLVFDASEPAYINAGTLLDLSLPSHRGALRKISNAVKRVFRLIFKIKNEQPDCIISFMESANFPAILAALFTGRLNRLSISVRNDPYRFNIVYRLLLPILYRFPKRVVAVSQGVGSALRRLGVPTNSLVNIPNPAPKHINLRTIKRPCEAPRRYILGVGRLHPQKGFDLLIHAFSAMADKDLHLVILGEGAQRVALENLAISLGIADRVFMPGVVHDLRPWYKHAACFTLSSRHEGWPNVIFEAMINECPVVSFDCNFGPSEIISHGVNGLLVDCGDVIKFVDAISSVIYNTDLRDKFIRAGVLRAKKFDISFLSQEWLTCVNTQYTP